MANARMLINNIADDATVTVTNGDENPSLPVENILKQSRAKLFRSSTTADLEITGVLPLSKDVSSFIIGRHNLCAGATYKLRLYSDAGATTQIFDSGNIVVNDDTAGSDLWSWGSFTWGSIPWGSDKSFDEFSPPAYAAIWLNNTYTIRSFKLIMTLNLAILANSSNIDSNNSTILANTTTTNISTISHYEIGRIMAGVYREPTYNISLGHGLTWEENTKQFRTDAGTLRSNISLPTRKFEFSLGTITEADRNIIQHEFRKAGMRKDMFISLFPDNESVVKEVDYSAIVKLTKIPKFTEFTNKYYNSKYIMEEV